MSNSFEVVNPGILTLIQDIGRFGYSALGVTPSGAMDEYAYLWANKLLDNDLNSNVLEVLFSGLTLKSMANCTISVTGADLSFSINGVILKPWQTFGIKRGDILKFEKTRKGQRAYFAVKGGFILEKSFGSYATTLKEQLGGIDGKALKKNDRLFFKENITTYKKRLKQAYQPSYLKPLTLRVILGYQEASFCEASKRTFFSHEYQVSHDNNRMAIKLKGKSVPSALNGIISEGISFGSIQIPKDGQPIILLKERQTIGGYPKIGSVLSIDCFKLSQLKANSMVRFEEIRLFDAQQKVIEFYSFFR